MKRKIKGYFKKLFKILAKPEMAILPSNIAFNLILAIIPILTIIVLIASSFDISIVVLPFVNLAYPPTSIMMGICANVANANKMPTAVKTLPSMTPIGGAQNPPASRPMEHIRQIQNGIVFRCCSFFFISLIS